MSEANKRARIAYLQSLVEARDDEIKMLRDAIQDAFDLGFKAAGGGPIYRITPALTPAKRGDGT